MIVWFLYFVYSSTINSNPHDIFSFKMILQPPSSTLFPYTTLFRSFSIPSVSDAPESRTTLSESEPIVGRDRKSTRLNSSHRCISYAVFCLKKKNACNEDMFYFYWRICLHRMFLYSSSYTR